jgi:hypothetical protein
MWKIAVFIQQLYEQRQTLVPAKWKRYPPNDPQYREGDTLVGFPEEDKKYLRVYYKVLDRWPCEAYKFEEKQIAPSSHRFVTTCKRVSDSEWQGSASDGLHNR